MSNCVIGFHSERQDPVSGVTHPGNGYRAYQPQLRRFVCPDSWSPFGPGGINPYVYCTGDPVNRTDPSGHVSISGAISVGLGLLGVLFTPVTGGMSLAATLSAASVLTGIASVGLGVAAEVAHDPHTSEVLGWVGIALGIASGVAVTAVSRLAPEAMSLAGRISTGLRSSSRAILASATSGNWERSILAAREQLVENSRRYMRTPAGTVPRLLNLAVDVVADNPALRNTASQRLPSLLARHVEFASGDWLLDLQGPFEQGRKLPAKAFLARKVFRAGQLVRGKYPEYAASDILNSDVARRYLLPLLARDIRGQYLSGHFARDMSRMINRIEPQDEFLEGVTMRTLPVNLWQYLHHNVIPVDWRSTFTDNVLPSLPW